MTFEAAYYDGRSSQRHQVRIEPDSAGGLRVSGDGVDVRWALSDVQVSSRIGDTARILYFPGGAQCETDDNDGVDRLFAPARQFSLYGLERRLSYAVLALVLTAVAIWVVIAYGIPALAKEVALSLPQSTESSLGADALQALDSTLLRPSALAPSRQAELRALVAGLASDGDTAITAHLEFRVGGRLGANALALPAGAIVLTDELVALAADDDELTAVLAHELGHVRHRHLMRMVLQNSATAVAIAVMIGDLTSLSSLAAALPTLLLQMAYSRQFELEADDFALALLARRGINGEKFGALLERIEARRGPSRSPSQYLSTHPDTRARVERAREANRR